MRRLALMIGIDKYPNLRRDFSLDGCVNDQELLRGILIERFGFEEGNIEFLADEQATRANILRALDRLAGWDKFAGQSIVQEDDLVLISYSGHGGRLREPPDQKDEADGYDSTLVTYDSDRPRPVGRGGPNVDITDDEIGARLQFIKERASHVMLFFDCCHSGTMSRDLDGAKSRSLPDDDRYDGIDRFIPSSRDLGEEKTPKGRSGWLKLDNQYLLIAGCADTEKSREYRNPETGKTHGALTYHFVRELERATGKMTYRDAFVPVRTAVNQLFSTQTPQMEGDWNRVLFGVEEIQVEPFVKVLKRISNRRVQIAAGTAHGVTVGSIWEIRPPELAHDQALAEVRIYKVDALSSEAETFIREPESLDDAPPTPTAPPTLPATINKQCRAIETEHMLGDMSITVAVDGTDPQALNQLRAKIKESPLLKLANEGPIEMVAVLLPPRQAGDVTDQSYAPELKAVHTPTWVIVGRDRHMMPTPLHTIDEENALQTTFENLETWARYFNTHRLRPISGDPLRKDFKAELYIKTGPGQDDTQAPPTHEATGLPLIKHGQKVQLRLTNYYRKPLYYVIYNLDAMGGVSRLWPPPSAEEALSYDETLPLEMGAYTVPEGFPTHLKGGRESFKIMLTLEPADFDKLQQAKTKPEDVLNAEYLFVAAQRGGSMMGVRPLRSQPKEHLLWTVAQIDYYMEAPI